MFDIKEYREQRKEYIKKQRAAYYLKNKEKIKHYNKEWSKNNLDKHRTLQKKWVAKNPERVKEIKRKHMSTHHHARLALNIRGRVREILKEYIKSQKTFDLIGCTRDELVKHLEKHFTDGMSWDNYGGKTGWHVDHIIPCAVFDLSDPVEQKQCCHYTNLQPMWGRENIQKGDTISELCKYLMP